MQRAWVLSMVGEPRCHIPCSVAKKKKKKARERCSQDPLIRDRTEKEWAPWDPENSNREREAAVPVQTRAIPVEQRTPYRKITLRTSKVQVVSIIGALGISV